MSQPTERLKDDLKDAFRLLHESVGPFEGKEMVMFYLLKEIRTDDDDFCYPCKICETMVKLMR